MQMRCAVSLAQGIQSRLREYASDKNISEKERKSMDTPITEQKTDNMDAELRADILVEALPYIQE